MTSPHPWYRASTTSDPLPGSGAGLGSGRGFDASPGGPVGYAPRAVTERLLGGPPIAVFMRLLFVSLVVGALLMWLDIRPFEVFYALRRLVDRLWYLSWDSIRAVLDYVIAGALLVVPCWLVLRLLSYRR